jgi:hypothetical protein
VRDFIAQGPYRGAYWCLVKLRQTAMENRQRRDGVKRLKRRRVLRLCLQAWTAYHRRCTYVDKGEEDR